jgi:hypothetical protein
MGSMNKVLEKSYFALMNRVENVVDRYVLAERSFYDAGLNGGHYFGHFRECFGRGNYPFGFFEFVIFLFYFWDCFAWIF